MGTDGRDRRWPRASNAPGTPKDADFETRRTNPVPILPLVVSEPLRPNKTFRSLQAALNLPTDAVRAILKEALNDPGTVPETISASQLLGFAPSLLHTIDIHLPEAERAAALARVEELLKGIGTN